MTKDSSALTIKGIGAAKKSLTLSELHTGESGLLTRMMIPLISMIGPGKVHITGEKTLTRRPLKGSKEIMGAFGVGLVPDEAHESAEVFVPLTVEGCVNAGKTEISGAGGSQLISGLLMALPFAEEDTVIHLKDPKSIP